MANDDARPITMAELSPLQDAVLDAQTLDQLFFDIGSAAELLQVVVKGAPMRDAATTSLTLSAAREALVSGAVAGVQIRYRYRGAEWWDTLMPVQDGVRLVRIEQHF